ncbi:hypothetical protein L3Q82_015217, partial [Scortum barcoo]
MTVDILVETGVGKTVNSFRKHEVAGEVAKSLVAKWKKLVPQSADRYAPHACTCKQSTSHVPVNCLSELYRVKRRGASTVPWGSPVLLTTMLDVMSFSLTYCDLPMGVGSMEQVEDGILHTNTWLVGELQAILGVLHLGSEEAEEEPLQHPQTATPRRHRGRTHTLEAQRQVVVEEEATDGPGGSPHLKKSPATWKKRRRRRRRRRRGYHTNYSSPHLLNTSSTAPRSTEGTSRTSTRAPSPSLNLSQSPPPPRKEVRHAKPNKEANKNHHHGSHGDRNRDRDEERRQRHPQMSSDRGGGGGREGGEGKKRSSDRERQQSPVQKSAKHSRKSTHESKREEKKRGGDDGRPRAPKDSPPKEEEEDFEAPTMSFESFLTYDAPTSVKKKKKPSSSSSSSHSRPSHSSSSTSSSSHRTRTSPPSAPSTSSSSSSKVNKANGAQSSKRPHSGSSSASAAPEKRKRVVEAVPTLPEIPLPAIQPNYRPLPSIDVTPLSPQRRKVPVLNDEEDAGFTGKRFNSKMVVYSGSKTSYLPRMMTLYEQCIRVLQNNIDSIAEVGGVPFEILEPVLERCTPEQLYRIEQSNQWFTEESDDLWMRHCQRDFKRESPQEYESWREMYLRLHDEREERLRLLTQNISSAHANKPKGRQVKMAFVNSVAKPPRDVRRRQERFGTTSGSSTAASTTAAAPIRSVSRPALIYVDQIRPANMEYSIESSRSSSSQNNPSPSSSRSSAPGGGGGGAGGGGHAARDKPQGK